MKLINWFKGKANKLFKKKSPAEMWGVELDNSMIDAQVAKSLYTTPIGEVRQIVHHAPNQGIGHSSPQFTFGSDWRDRLKHKFSDVKESVKASFDATYGLAGREMAKKFQHIKNQKTLADALRVSVGMKPHHQTFETE